MEIQDFFTKLSVVKWHHVVSQNLVSIGSNEGVSPAKAVII